MVIENGIKNIQATAYNGARTVYFDSITFRGYFIGFLKYLNERNKFF